MVGGGRNEGCLLLSLREAYIPNLSTLLSLEPLEKVPGGGWWMGGGWVCKPSLVFSFGPKLNKMKCHPAVYVSVISVRSYGISEHVYLLRDFTVLQVWIKKTHIIFAGEKI